MNLSEKIRRDIKLADKCRDFKWIKEKQDQRRLMLGEGYYMNDDVFNKFRLLVKSAQEVYENSWDLDIKIVNANSEDDYVVVITGLVIHFKNIKIKNSRNKSHDITDLFVKVLLDASMGLRIASLWGGRTSVTYEEWCSHYMHSHLPGSGIQRSGFPPYWANFCRGSGHINDFIAEINSEGLTEENVTPFLVQILGLVSWESLEGGPHKVIASIKPTSHRGRTLNPSPRIAIQYKDALIESHKATNITPEINLSYESGKYKIKDDTTFNKFLERGLTDSWKRQIVGLKADNGVYYTYGQLPGFQAPPTIDKKYIFQGQEITPTIGPPPNLGDLKEENYEIHPIIKSVIKQELEYDINFKKIRESTIDRYTSKNGNVRESAQSDKMAM